MRKPGWLSRQLNEAEESVKNWPAWMREVAGLEGTKKDSSTDRGSAEESHRDESTRRHA